MPIITLEYSDYNGEHIAILHPQMRLVEVVEEVEGIFRAKLTGLERTSIVYFSDMMVKDSSLSFVIASKTSELIVPRDYNIFIFQFLNNL